MGLGDEAGSGEEFANGETYGDESANGEDVNREPANGDESGNGDAVNGDNSNGVGDELKNGEEEGESLGREEVRCEVLEFGRCRFFNVLLDWLATSWSDVESREMTSSSVDVRDIRSSCACCFFLPFFILVTFRTNLRSVGR